MTHNTLLRFTLSVCIPVLLLSFQAGCKKEKPVVFEITSHSEGDVVYDPLPMTLKGTISNFRRLPDKQKENLNIYIAEKSTLEKIWHLEPRGRVDEKGNWKALTWLGNPTQGRRSDYILCVFSSPERLTLNDGNHPVKERPPHNGEKCITLKRRD